MKQKLTVKSVLKIHFLMSVSAVFSEYVATTTAVTSSAITATETGTAVQLTSKSRNLRVEASTSSSSSTLPMVIGVSVPVALVALASIVLLNCIVCRKRQSGIRHPEAQRQSSKAKLTGDSAEPYPVTVFGHTNSFKGRTHKGSSGKSDVVSSLRREVDINTPTPTIASTKNQAYGLDDGASGETNSASFGQAATKQNQSTNQATENDSAYSYPYVHLMVGVPKQLTEQTKPKPPPTMMRHYYEIPDAVPTVPKLLHYEVEDEGATTVATFKLRRPASYEVPIDQLSGPDLPTEREGKNAYLTTKFKLRRLASYEVPQDG